MLNSMFNYLMHPNIINNLLFYIYLDPLSPQTYTLTDYLYSKLLHKNLYHNILTPLFYEEIHMLYLNYHL